MKAFFFTEEQLVNLMLKMSELHERNMGLPGYSYKQMATEVLRDYPLIEIDDANIGELNAPCKFFPSASIVGFSQKDGFLKGVFVKE